MEDSFAAFPVAFLQFFDNDENLKNYFLSLPEEDQQALIREDLHSGKDLYDCIARHKLRD